MARPFTLALLVLAAGPAALSRTTAASGDAAAIDDLVAASRILADQGVLDGFGHVSIRHPEDPAKLLMSRSLAPALVTPADIMG